MHASLLLFCMTDVICNITEQETWLGIRKEAIICIRAEAKWLLDRHTGRQPQKPEKRKRKNNPRENPILEWINSCKQNLHEGRGTRQSPRYLLDFYDVSFFGSFGEAENGKGISLCPQFVTASLECPNNIPFIGERQQCLVCKWSNTKHCSIVGARKEVRSSTRRREGAFRCQMHATNDGRNKCTLWMHFSYSRVFRKTFLLSALNVCSTAQTSEIASLSSPFFPAWFYYVICWILVCKNHPRQSSGVNDLPFLTKLSKEARACVRKFNKIS